MSPLPSFLWLLLACVCACTYASLDDDKDLLAQFAINHGRSKLPTGCSYDLHVVNCTNTPGLNTDTLGDMPLYFSQLQSLHLRGNRLEYLDKDTFHLNTSNGWNLRQLDLSNNAISDLNEDALIKMPYLENLNLSNNRISFQRRPIAPGHRVVATGRAFLKNVASKLQILDLSNAFDETERQSTISFMKSLKQLLFDPINRFDDLQYLHLSRLSLTALPEDAFRWMPNLQYLYLSGNKLIDFRLDSTTQSGKELMELRLDSNQFKTVDERFTRMVDEHSTLSRVYLGNNPFVCDCRIKSFIKWAKTTRKLGDKEAMLCSSRDSPRQFANRSLISIDEDQLRCSNNDGGKSAVYTAGVTALCVVAALGLASLLTCIIYANKNILCRTGTNIRNWLTMATSGGYEILESGRPGVVKAEAV